MEQPIPCLYSPRFSFPRPELRLTFGLPFAGSVLFGRGLALHQASASDGAAGGSSRGSSGSAAKGNPAGSGSGGRSLTPLRRERRWTTAGRGRLGPARARRDGRGEAAELRRRGLDRRGPVARSGGGPGRAAAARRVRAHGGRSVGRGGTEQAGRRKAAVHGREATARCRTGGGWHDGLRGGDRGRCPGWRGPGHRRGPQRSVHPGRVRARCLPSPTRLPRVGKG